jgi:uncharacterized protein YkwD
VPPGSQKALALLALVLALAFAAPAASAAPTRAERALLTAVNEARTAHGRVALVFAQPLQRRSHRYAQWLLRTDSFHHATNLAPGTRENLAWATANIASARRVVRMWLGSPGHRRNLLWRAARRAGVGVARGPYLGYPDVRMAVLRVRG